MGYLLWDVKIKMTCIFLNWLKYMFNIVNEDGIQKPTCISIDIGSSDETLFVGYKEHDMHIFNLV